MATLRNIILKEAVESIFGGLFFIFQFNIDFFLIILYTEDCINRFMLNYFPMKYLIIILSVLCICSCTKVSVEEQLFSSMDKQGNTVTLSTISSSSASVVTLADPVYVSDFIFKTDTLLAKTFKTALEDELRTKMVSRRDVYTGYESKNFSVVGKMYEMQIRLPYIAKDGTTGTMQTSFAFIREIPMLNGMDTYYPSVRVRAELDSFKQDSAYREPYSELTYTFCVTLLEEDIEVGHFTFNRMFAVANNPVTFIPKIEDWGMPSGGEIPI